MKPNKHEPEVETVISDATVRFTMAVFLALFALGAALLIWRGLSSVPDGDHRIDQTTGALRAFSTFAAILLVLYLVITARVFSERLEGQLGLRYQQGLADGRHQAAQRFKRDAGEVWRDWSDGDELAEATRRDRRPTLSTALSGKLRGLTPPLTPDPSVP